MLSRSFKGLKSWHKDGVEIRSKECPGEGWKHGSLNHPVITEQAKQKLREDMQKRIHWTNGVEEKFQEECPGEGWVKGRLKKAS